MSSTDTGSSSVNRSLRLNGGYSVNCDSGNTLVRSGVLSSDAGEFIMVDVDYWDRGNDGSVTMNVDVSSGGDGGLLSLT